MSADRLRAAASAIRQRAEQASPSPWRVSKGADMEHGADVICFYDDDLCEPDYEGTSVAAAMAWEGACTEADAEHIASWHPAVALAVADLLDLIATRHAPHDRSRVVREVVCDHDRVEWPCDHMTCALAVADAYLTTTADLGRPQDADP